MKNDSTIYVGLDVHKESIVAAYAVDMGEVQSLAATSASWNVTWIGCVLGCRAKASRVIFVYEAGPCALLSQVAPTDLRKRLNSVLFRMWTNVLSSRLRNLSILGRARLGNCQIIFSNVGRMLISGQRAGRPGRDRNR